MACVTPFLLWGGYILCRLYSIPVQNCMYLYVVSRLVCVLCTALCMLKKFADSIKLHHCAHVCIYATSYWDCASEHGCVCVYVCTCVCVCVYACVRACTSVLTLALGGGCR